MSDETKIQFAIAKCKTILREHPVKIYRFNNMYTIKDVNSGDVIFELKSAEFCNADNKIGESCECLIVNKEKLLIGENGNTLLNLIQQMYDEQRKKINDKPGSKILNSDKDSPAAECERILREDSVRIYKWADMYTVKNESNDVVFEIKPSEYYNPEIKNDENHKCLVMNKVKFLVSTKETDLFDMIKDIYEKQRTKAPVKKSVINNKNLGVLDFLDTYIR